MARWQWYLQLARASNLPTVWTNALAAWALAGGGWNPLAWLWLALAGSLLYAGGCTLNDAFDAAWDREHRPERAIPSGALSAREVWLVGSLELLGGLAVLVQFGWSVLASGAGVVVAILLYDWLHKKSPWAVLLMGWCRAQWVLTAGWAAAGKPSASVLFYASALLTYIVVISLSARRESLVSHKVHAWERAQLQEKIKDRAGDQTIPIPNPALRWFRRIFSTVFVGLVMVGAFAFRPLADALSYFLLMILFIVHFEIISQAMLLKGRAGIGTFVARALAGIVLLDAAFACLAWGWSGLWLLCFWPLCLLLQRRIAAT